MSKIINIDWKLVGALLEADCSGVQIAGKLGIHENTLYLRCKKELKMDFVAFRTQKQASGEALIKVKQFESAVKDKDKSMLIWLGKQRLGQKDKQATDIKISNNLTEEEIDRRLTELRNKVKD